MSTEHAIYMTQPGDASVLQSTEVVLSPPGATEVRVRHTAIGVNFVDIYHRTGLYRLPELPAVLGVEAAGVIEVLGADVHGLAVGDRVVYAGPPVGGYATARNLPAAKLLRIPEGVSDIQAASALLRGITAHMLLQYVRPVRAGDTILVQAAAGGLGQVLGQWGASLGARMIGTVGSEAKGAVALSKGYEVAIPYRQTDFVTEVLRLTEGQGVDFAIDGIGGETLNQTLQAVRPFGLVASVGQVAVGGNEDTAVLPLRELGPYRSIGLARPGVFRFMTDPARYREGGHATLARLAAGMSVDVSVTLPLGRAAEAQHLLETGQTSGAVILLPN
jgi:NADPH:quinone reductase-like Zn-dependent oxidoreductase